MHLQLSFTFLHHHYLCVLIEIWNQKDKIAFFMHSTLTVKLLSVNLGALLCITDSNSTIGVLEKTKIACELVSSYMALF